MTAAPSLLDYTIRAAEPGDRRFIIETTAKVRQPREMSWTDWKRRGLAESELDLDNGEALVGDADGVLVGFMVISNGALAMVYVKRDFRGAGVGYDLLVAKLGLPPPPVRVSTVTGSWRRWARLHRIRWEEVR